MPRTVASGSAETSSVSPERSATACSSPSCAESPPPTRSTSAGGRRLDGLQRIGDLVRDAGERCGPEVGRRRRAARAQDGDPVGAVPVGRAKAGRSRDDHRMRPRPVGRPGGEAQGREQSQRIAGIRAEGLEHVGGPRDVPDPGGRGQHARRRLRRPGADVQQEEGAGAQRERRRAGRRAALAVERRRLVAEHRGHRRVQPDAAPETRTPGSSDGRISGSRARGTPNRPSSPSSQRRVARSRSSERQAFEGSVTCARRRRGASRASCDSPKSHLARLRPLLERGVGFEEPGELRRGDGRVERRGPSSRAPRPPRDAERGAELGGALILPAHHGRDRPSRSRAPRAGTTRSGSQCRPRRQPSPPRRRPRGSPPAPRPGARWDRARPGPTPGAWSTPAGPPTHAPADADRRRRSECSSCPGRERGSRQPTRCLFIRAGPDSPGEARQARRFQRGRPEGSGYGIRCRCRYPGRPLRPVPERSGRRHRSSRAPRRNRAGRGSLRRACLRSGRQPIVVDQLGLGDPDAQGHARGGCLGATADARSIVRRAAVGPSLEAHQAAQPRARRLQRRTRQTPRSHRGSNSMASLDTELPNSS